MRNIKLEIEYDGKRYAGWQLQNRPRALAAGGRKRTIQFVIERTLRKIVREKIRLIASGRTDSGAHALAQAANFRTKSKIPLSKLQLALNGLLPDDIAITGIEERPLDFHSRFDAKSKVYRYAVLNRRHPSAFLRERVYFYPYPLDLVLMQREARCLLGRHDFNSFCASGSGRKSTLRCIKSIRVKRLNPNPSTLTPALVIIEIKADGFLYNMVRNIAGTLVEIGRGRFKRGDLKRILAARDRRLAGPTLPAKGLTLLKVKY